MIIFVGCGSIEDRKNGIGAKQSETDPASMKAITNGEPELTDYPTFTLTYENIELGMTSEVTASTVINETLKATYDLSKHHKYSASRTENETRNFKSVAMDSMKLELGGGLKGKTPDISGAMGMKMDWSEESKIESKNETTTADLIEDEYLAKLSVINEKISGVNTKIAKDSGYISTALRIVNFGKSNIVLKNLSVRLALYDPSGTDRGIIAIVSIPEALAQVNDDEMPFTSIPVCVKQLSTDIMLRIIKDRMTIRPQVQSYGIQYGDKYYESPAVLRSVIKENTALITCYQPKNIITKRYIVIKNRTPITVEEAAKRFLDATLDGSGNDFRIKNIGGIETNIDRWNDPRQMRSTDLAGGAWVYFIEASKGSRLRSQNTLETGMHVGVVYLTNEDIWKQHPVATICKFNGGDSDLKDGDYFFRLINVPPLSKQAASQGEAWRVAFIERNKRDDFRAIDPAMTAKSDELITLHIEMKKARWEVEEFPNNFDPPNGKNIVGTSFRGIGKHLSTINFVDVDDINYLTRVVRIEWRDQSAYISDLMTSPPRSTKVGYDFDLRLPNLGTEETPFSVIIRYPRKPYMLGFEFSLSMMGRPMPGGAHLEKFDIRDLLQVGGCVTINKYPKILMPSDGTVNK